MNTKKLLLFILLFTTVFIVSLIVGLFFASWYFPKADNSYTPELSKNYQKSPHTLPSELSQLNPQRDTQSNTSYPASVPVVVPSLSAPGIPVEDQPISVDSHPHPGNVLPPVLSEPAPEYLDPMYQEKSNPPNPKKTSLSNINTYLGHFAFAENSSKRLVTVGKYYHRTEYLDQEAALAFKQMKARAQTQGIQLMIISGFRSIADQERLFQQQIQRRGNKEAAARLSAPPGHSEHHTGYALDIGDGNYSNTDLKFQFESTPAYSWLVNNAYKYGFELSFPQNNSQGVSFEPWHWRYVNSVRASQIFAASKSIR
ncbi:M15 family metallopeptidase [Umezakia ovalisporum]|jgi:LAS superfamily LD-carboxypeptidase LdcB|uniref:M15 family metallopeptidase n=1 Tax=Umezakia ovalisporum TaxID=75695 RepID=UPI000B01275D|nr:M15 family metallopeptidase [Umezakia ovalisporum]MBI1241863.1 D-alanyl-D-alanine carboxypeptidase family protein [Nostoc sp. RI_552]MDH6085900.1 M15 family metallopeptidase [Umezakia ovalisporum TAC611]MDH6087439.1 M15 family metallopeptidase [Umezakia ovalisporum Ak1311]